MKTAYKGLSKFRKILVAPDKFKGTIDATRICHTIQKMINKRDPSIEVACIPLSDGGDGFVECIGQNLEGAHVKVAQVTGPMGESVEAEYCIHPESSTSYLEVANVSGLQLVPEHSLNPFVANSYGLGELIMIVNQLNIENKRLTFLLFQFSYSMSNISLQALKNLNFCILNLFC